tara:strand:+ start:112 stop:1062 length:951 start_codon:yes stop_codon:yes gene_type:complete
MATFGRVFPPVVDLKGTELILDADADTTITADTDDQIDIKIAGADDFQITANTMSVLSGSTLNIDSGASIDVASGGTIDVVGDLTVGTVTADGDTSAGDSATIGYTAAEGLILTGQGSTNDITIKNDADADVITIATGGTDVEISTGNLVIGTSGKGIDFSATADSGGTMTSELLDDYEEGTFTPAYTFGGSSTGITYNANGQLGRYTKIGRVVICDIYLGMTDKGSESGNVVITGLPFTSVNHGLNTSAIVNIGSHTGGWDLSAEAHFTGDVGTGVVTIALRECVFSTDANPNAVTAAMATDDGQMYLSVTYEAT